MKLATQVPKEIQVLFTEIWNNIFDHQVVVVYIPNCQICFIIQVYQVLQDCLDILGPKVILDQKDLMVFLDHREDLVWMESGNGLINTHMKWMKLNKTQNNFVYNANYRGQPGLKGEPGMKSYISQIFTFFVRCKMNFCVIINIFLKYRRWHWNDWNARY